METIVRDFGSFENMKARLSNATVAVQGSGWGWLVSDRYVYLVDASFLMGELFQSPLAIRIFAGGW